MTTEFLNECYTCNRMCVFANLAGGICIGGSHTGRYTGAMFGSLVRNFASNSVKMKVIPQMVFLLNIVKYTSSQYITVGAVSNRKPGKSTCDNTSKSALVEHFFTTIFNEFHTAPPVCVCVQMCPDQPTYCYPNGCFKRVEYTKKVEVPVTRISENTKPIFFSEGKNDFMHDLLNKNYVDENKATPGIGVSKQANIMPINIRPDPFKDRYKILFKYKKMPKVELKYNLGEQVKNMKSDALRKDNVDISKTRWPVNKINSMRLNRQRIYSDNQGYDNTNFFSTTQSEKEVKNDPPKYFKRELVNITKNNTDGLDKNIGFETNELESKSYSLEKLIDSMIESSFKPNETINMTSQNNIQTDTSTETNDQILETTEIIVIKESSTITPLTENTLNSDTTKVISMNLTNENVDKNKYIETDTNNTRQISQMIASMSKKIDIQNNTSLEIMRQMVGNFDMDSISVKPIEQIALSDNFEVVTTENSIKSTDFTKRVAKKSRQRLARKLNSKNN